MSASHFLRGLAIVIAAQPLLGVGRGYAQVPAEKPTEAREELVADLDAIKPLDKETLAVMPEMIALLGAQSYADRERASDRLRKIGPRSFPYLQVAYARTDDLEVKLRIEEVVRDTYIDEHVYSRNGFLGISQGGRPKLPAEYKQIPPGHVGIVVSRVHDETAARRAGLVQKDVIIALGGTYIEHTSRPTATFGNMIREYHPDQEVVLTILRNGVQIELPVTLGRCPEAMVKLNQIQAVTIQLDQARQGFRDWWHRNFQAPGNGASVQPAPSRPAT